MWAQMWAKKKAMRIAHIFFVKLVGAFSEKKSFWKSKSKGRDESGKGKNKLYFQFAIERGVKIEIYVQKKVNWFVKSQSTIELK